MKIMAEEDSCPELGDLEKGTKRRQGENDEEDILIKRLKVENEADEDETDDDNLHIEQNTSNELQQEETDDDNLHIEQNTSNELNETEADADGNASSSEINDNSDVSQNSISYNDNNLMNSATVVKLEDEEHDERSQTPPLPVILSEKSLYEQNPVVENGRGPSLPTSSTRRESNELSLEPDENSSEGNLSREQKPDDTVLQKLEKELEDMNTLLLLKEKEWNAILRLKKLKEIALAQIRRRKDVQKVLERASSEASGVDSIQMILQMIVGESIKTGAGVAHVQTSIMEIEEDVNDLVKQVSKAGKQDVNERNFESGGDSVQAERAFLATNALKSLVNKNKTVTPNQADSLNQLTSVKVIGEGRKGPIVDVASLIASYRSNSPVVPAVDYYTKPKFRRNKLKVVNPLPAPAYTPLNQSVDISFSDALARFKTIFEKHKETKDVFANAVGVPSPSPNSLTKSAAVTSKPKGNSSTNSSTASGSGKGAVGTTLAKLLSSSNAGSGNRIDSEDSLQFTMKAAIANSTSDKNLSLANLLASSKSRDDPKKNKVDPRNVPLCQGCNANKAQFVCAGCANQWYCSRDCQVTAWDDHSEVCSG